MQGRRKGASSCLPPSAVPFWVASFPLFSWQLCSPPTCPPTSWTHKASPSSQQAVLVTVQAGGSLSPWLGGAQGLTQGASMASVGVCPLGALHVGGAASLPQVCNLGRPSAWPLRTTSVGFGNNQSTSFLSLSPALYLGYQNNLDFNEVDLAPACYVSGSVCAVQPEQVTERL